MSDNRPNAHMIFLPTELYMGLIKKMAAFEVGKSAAILSSINEDLLRQGFISKETYEKFKASYGKKLVDVVNQKQAEVQALSQALPIRRVQLAEDVRVANLEKEFKMALDQWNLHPGLEWRLKWLKRAEQHKDEVPSAKLPVELAASS